MRNKIILLFSLLLVVFFANAQDEEENTGILTTSETEELLQVNIIEFGSPVINDILQLQQVGDDNKLIAIQQLSDNTSYVFTAKQTGDGNIGYVNQTGNNHESLLFQNGNLNIANLWSVGANTQNFVQQEGNANLVNSFVENFNSPSKTVTSIQIGDDNEINLALIDEGASLSGIAVLQTGQSNFAELYLNHFDSPYLNVVQTGGAKISITHTDFSFPTK